MELETRRKEGGLSNMAKEREALAKEVARLKADNEELRGGNDKLAAEKMEIGAANNELKSRLQQSYMQVRTQRSSPLIC